ncbi:MAG: tRNA (adenosine(37)-N6)-threonylcarbamoyltransferase complex transferase subunit TsaD [Phyllobacteriaceae bacterium]|nr:tRNA (adenosine(37)-N6)-threonylcarbamoyltransferase complex transferase subunit TsaD [Phyllobacteriaceae bacterium]
MLTRPGRCIRPYKAQQARNAILPAATLFLGIETSCDETAAAVVALSADGRAEIRSNAVLSQIEEHAAFGGVVPEIAARAHVEALDGIIRAALADAGATLADIDGVAATAGPGLIGGLIVGLVTARAIAAATGKTLVPVNHLEGHALSPRLIAAIDFPYLLLLVSGGHTQIVAVEGVGRYRRMASTIEDALGEAFDKTAKLLGLPYPGGPALEIAAQTGDSDRFALPRPMKGEARPDFSFSGLKTAVRQAATAIAPLTEQDIADLAASFQKAAADAVADRVARALDRFLAEHPGSKRPTLVIAGGVAANKALRAALEETAAKGGFTLVAPPLALCTDNAAMIAWAGLERFRAGLLPANPFALEARPRWPLDEAAAPLYGAGRKGAKA